MAITNMDKVLLIVFQEELLNPSQTYCILKIVYEFFKFSALTSKAQYGICQCIMNNASSLYMTQQAGKETNFNS